MWGLQAVPLPVARVVLEDICEKLLGTRGRVADNTTVSPVQYVTAE